jgi:hypothetical protein
MSDTRDADPFEDQDAYEDSDPVEPGSLQGSGPFENQDSDGDMGIDGGGRGPGRDLPKPSRDLRKNMERLDALLAAADDEEKVRAGMGIRLALGMAYELKQGKPLGTETGELVAGWVRKYGHEAVDIAVKVAREFLTKPEDMRMALGRSLGMGPAE